MRFFKSAIFIVVTFICSFIEIEAADVPEILGLFPGMNRARASEVVNDLCSKYNLRLIQLTNTPKIIMPTPERMNETMSNPFARPMPSMSDIMLVSSFDPLTDSHSTKECHTLNQASLRRIKPTNSFALVNDWGIGVVLLGFNQNELVEIMIAPRLFNWDKYSHNELINMLQKQWSVRFTKDISWNTPIWHAIMSQKFLIHFDHTHRLYIGKLISQKDSAPTMNMIPAGEKFYTCTYCQNKSGSNTQPQIMPANINAPVPVPFDPGLSSGSAMRTPRPCTGCNGTGYSRYGKIYPANFGNDTDYNVWCDLCGGTDKAHSHKVCGVCNGAKSL